MISAPSPRKTWSPLHLYMSGNVTFGKLLTCIPIQPFSAQEAKFPVAVLYVGRIEEGHPGGM